MSIDVTTILLCLFYTLQSKLSAMLLIRLKIYQGKCPCFPYGSYTSAYVYKHTPHVLIDQATRKVYINHKIPMTEVEGSA